MMSTVPEPEGTPQVTVLPSVTSTPEAEDPPKKTPRGPVPRFSPVRVITTPQVEAEWLMPVRTGSRAVRLCVVLSAGGSFILMLRDRVTG